MNKKKKERRGLGMIGIYILFASHSKIGTRMNRRAAHQRFTPVT
jgi:hypothetical protein